MFMRGRSKVLDELAAVERERDELKVQVTELETEVDEWMERGAAKELELKSLLRASELRVKRLEAKWPTLDEGPLTDDQLSAICHEVAHLSGDTLLEQVQSAVQCSRARCGELKKRDGDVRQALSGMALYARQRDSEREIVDLVHSIMGNGTFVVETPNEAVLVKMMELRGTPLPIESSLRDIEADWQRHLKELAESKEGGA